VRAMTSSSGPGVSLKQEGISYLAGCELPALIVNVMRAGPGLGDISSSQSDYFQATRGGGHGDYFTPVLAPWSVEEAVKLVMLGFDIADYYRNPVLILADAIIGQMMEPVGNFDKSQFRKKKESKNWALTGAKGRPANSIKSLYLKEGVLEQHNKKLKKKWDKIRKNEQRFFVSDIADVDYLIVAYGSQARISLEAIKMLRKNNIKVGLFRPISLWPFPGKGLRKIAEKVKKILVVEQSLGQMVEDVKLNLPNKEVYFLGRAGGGVPSAGEIIKYINNKLI
ncbi:MAG: 3-methyl-2-oxobutanoate dehydrogenase subunit beta, partial [Candidatus Omnitrophica bacterium]|nr:3-methyl-2-oxobutanoate dehydrogenase subunit beta [Candidatus Omnitrophota bacterium]